LNNAVKHAGAKRIRLQLVRAGERARLVFEDDGKGYASGAAAGDGARGFGTATLRERVIVLGGELQIDSAPGQGTRVVVEFPLPS
jgi:signal transduction histidine kinase